MFLRAESAVEIKVNTRELSSFELVRSEQKSSIIMSLETELKQIVQQSVTLICLMRE